MNWTQADYNVFLARKLSTPDRVPNITVEKCTGIFAIAAGVEDEIRDLHRPIQKFCTEMGWVYFYSNPTRKTGRTLGEPDFTILADRSRVFFIECKSRGGELSPGQEILKKKALYLGHTIETVYTMDQFYELVKI